MRRVVVTGLGIWSCIGQDLRTVTESLRQGRSGIIFDSKRIEYGLQSGLVGSVPRPDLKPLLPRKFRATMSEDSEYAYMATRQAFEQAGISDEYLLQNEIGIIFGSDYITNGKVEGVKLLKEEKDSMVLGPNSLFKSETSSVSMNLSSIFHLRGINLCVGAACASSLHAIGLASTFIRQGLQDLVLVGGANETSVYGAALLDGIGALSVQNNTPKQASRPYDRNRDGYVTSGGAAALMLEEYEHAKARGATILAEVCGYGFSTDGTSIIERNPNQVVLAMNRALKDAGISYKTIDYVASCASGALYEDVIEAQALSSMFSNTNTWVSATESITGHEHNMAGAGKMIYTIAMMQNGFVAPTINLKEVISEAKELNISTKMEHANINHAMINAMGLGNTNCSIIIKKI